MATFLISGSYGPENPTRASMPFHIGRGAVEAGHEVCIVLAVDAPVLLKDAVRESIVGVGMPPLKELFQFAVDHNSPIYT